MNKIIGEISFEDHFKVFDEVFLISSLISITILFINKRKKYNSSLTKKEKLKWKLIYKLNLYEYRLSIQVITAIHLDSSNQFLRYFLAFPESALSFLALSLQVTTISDEIWLPLLYLWPSPHTSKGINKNTCVKTRSKLTHTHNSAVRASSCYIEVWFCSSKITYWVWILFFYALFLP